MSLLRSSVNRGLPFGVNNPRNIRVAKKTSRRLRNTFSFLQERNLFRNNQQKIFRARKNQVSQRFTPANASTGTRILTGQTKGLVLSRRRPNKQQRAIRV